MLTIELPQSVEEKLTALASQRGLNPTDYVREAIERLIEDHEDASIAEERLRNPGKRWTLEELENGRDLGG
jgi:RHH-type rel operon transcriptional repressor/antitoxin RelB